MSDRSGYALRYRVELFLLDQLLRFAGWAVYAACAFLAGYIGGWDITVPIIFILGVWGGGFLAGYNRKRDADPDYRRRGYGGLKVRD